MGGRTIVDSQQDAAQERGEHDAWGSHAELPSPNTEGLVLD